MPFNPSKPFQSTRNSGALSASHKLSRQTPRRLQRGAYFSFSQPGLRLSIKWAMAMAGLWRGWMCVKVQALETCWPQKSTGHKGAQAGAWAGARGGNAKKRHPHSPNFQPQTPLLLTSTVSYGHGKQIIAKLHFPRLLPPASCDLDRSLHRAAK